MRAQHGFLRDLTALSMAAVLTWGATPAIAAGDTVEFALNVPVPDSVLAELRGGFFFESSGLQASFSVAREVLINGQMVLQGRIIISNLDAMLAGRAPTVEIIGQPLGIVQNGPGNFAPSSIPTVSGTAPAVASNATAPVVAGPAVANQPSASNASSTMTAPAGVGTTTNITTTQPPAVATVPNVPTAQSIIAGVQNTLDNQLIQMRTTINAAVSSINLLRSQLANSNLRDQILGGVSR